VILARAARARARAASPRTSQSAYQPAGHGPRTWILTPLAPAPRPGEGGFCQTLPGDGGVRQTLL